MADSFSNQLPDLRDAGNTNYNPRNPPCRPAVQGWPPLMWPNVGLFTSLMPFLDPDATPFPIFRRFNSSRESCPLSDDEKIERIRVQQMMRNAEPVEWEGEPIELSTLNFGRDDLPRDAVMDSERDRWGEPI
ncbi:hypothetical protein KR074_008802 [Drosophila pseudoananassae]|nr:hypothetical protein KR074_008802 [Drosophila pseudoananassae]